VIRLNLFGSWRRQLMSNQQLARPQFIAGGFPHPIAGRPLDAVALKWRELVERRSGHFLDLYASGRWRHYYTEEQFLARFQEALEMSERWAQIAPKPDDGHPARSTA